VLHLIEGSVADAHRPGIGIPRQVAQFVLDEAALPADAVHHLKRARFAVVGAADFGDEGEEVVGLVIQPQRVQAPQRERGVPDPRIAVVPVAFALRGFRQRGGARRQNGSGRRVAQPLERQRAALQVRPPGMVGEVADVDPLAPALAGRPHLVGSLGVGLRRGIRREAQRHEDVVTLLQPGPGPRLPPVQTDPQVRRQPKRRMRIRVLLGPRHRLAIAGGRVLPTGGIAVVVERGLTVHHQFDGPADAAHRPQQRVLGVPVHRGPAMGVRPGLDVVPRTHHKGVPHDHPAGVGLPGGLQDHRARQVPPRRGHRDTVGTDPKVPSAAIEDRTEQARRIRTRCAQPLNRPSRRDQAGVLAIRKKRVVRDRRKWISRVAACVRRRRGCSGFRDRAVRLRRRDRILKDHRAIIDGLPACRTGFASGTPSWPDSHQYRRATRKRFNRWTVFRRLRASMCSDPI
jgi:hypothetical protein